MIDLDIDFERRLKNFPEVWKRVSESKAADVRSRDNAKTPQRQKVNRRRFEGNR